MLALHSLQPSAHLLHTVGVLAMQLLAGVVGEIAVARRAPTAEVAVGATEPMLRVT